MPSMRRCLSSCWRGPAPCIEGCKAGAQPQPREASPWDLTALLNAAGGQAAPGRAPPVAGAPDGVAAPRAAGCRRRQRRHAAAAAAPAPPAERAGQEPRVPQRRSSAVRRLLARYPHRRPVLRLRLRPAHGAGQRDLGPAAPARAAHHARHARAGRAVPAAVQARGRAVAGAIDTRRCSAWSTRRGVVSATAPTRGAAR